MTDNEIIKALECCIEGWCEKCPYGDRDDVVACQQQNGIDALNLINRQKAEKEALIAGQETLQKYIAEQKAEIERLQNELDIRPPASASYLFKKAELDEMLIRAIGAEEAYKAKIKAEAIKEFAERLEGEQLFLSGCVPWYDIQNKISWIAKEMDQSQK